MLDISPVYAKRSLLAKSLSPSDTTLRVSYGDGHKFKVADGSHFYLTIKSQSNLTREVVKVLDVVGDELTIERGVDNTTASSFLKGACLMVEWNPAQLCEFVQQCATGDSPKVKPQTLCMTCDTCFDVDEGGHIIEVRRGKEC